MLSIRDLTHICANGAGRSSLMRCLATLQVPTSGQIQFGAIDVLKQPEALRATLGYLPQDFGGYPRDTVNALIGNPQLIIVDEPTAGLGPEECNRFNNLLNEIGESLVVILSTHIVDDVTDLCPHMAILVGRRIVQTGTPGERIAALQGRIWQASIAKHELDAAKAQQAVIATRLRAGRTVIRMLADASPGVGLAAVEGGLSMFASIARFEWR